MIDLENEKTTDGATFVANEVADPEMRAAIQSSFDHVEQNRAELSRNQRLLDAVAYAKTAVAGGAFTQQQAATLSAVFDRLGAAIAGEETPR